VVSGEDQRELSWGPAVPPVVGREQDAIKAPAELAAHPPTNLPVRANSCQDAPPAPPPSTDAPAAPPPVEAPPAAPVHLPGAVPEVYIYTNTHTHTNVHRHTLSLTHTRVCVFVYMCVRVCVCVCVCVDVWVCGSEKERVQEEKNEECVDEWLNLGSRAVKPG